MERYKAKYKPSVKIPVMFVRMQIHDRSFNRWLFCNLI